MQGHAVSNVIPVVGANRTGFEPWAGYPNGGQEFYGSSFIADHTGHKVAEAARTGEAILLQRFDLDAIRRERQSFGFFRDRRPAMYQTLLTSDGFTAAR